MVVVLTGCASVQPTAPTVRAPEHHVDRNYQIGIEQSVFVGQPMVRVKDYYAQQADMQVLRPDQAFQMRMPPFGPVFTAAAGQDMPVVGTTTRDGVTYRLVQMSAQGYAFPVRLLVTPEGRFEGSGISAIGERMGWTYKPSPADVQLLPAESSAVVASKGFTNYELVYGGTNGDSMQVMYREYTPDDMARPAFTQQLVYSLASKSIRFRDVQIRVTSADNEKITYTVLSDGQP